MTSNQKGASNKDMSSHQPRTSKSTGVTPDKKVTDRKTTESRLKPKLITAAILTLFFAFALFLRVYLCYDNVFTTVGIKFTSNDSYFFMRLVDNLVHNFPNYTGADPYLQYPVYSGKVVINFLVWILAVPAWIIGLGSPSEHLIDVVGVYEPAILGALTVIPVYFIGRELFGRWAGVLSAALVAILPGEFLGRSILGFTDNHIAETLFAAVTMMFLILAVKAASQRQLAFSHLKQRDWATIRTPLIYSLLAALFLGIYIFTWLGALLFVFVTFLFFVIQFVIDHLKHKSTDYLCIVGAIFFFVTLIIALMVSSSMLYLASLFIATLAMLVLGVLSRMMANKKMVPVYFPLALLGLAGVGVGFLYLINRSLFGTMLSAFSIFRPAGAQLTTIEMQPLISNIYGNPLAIALGNFPGLFTAAQNAPAGWNLSNVFPFLSSTLFFSILAICVLLYLLFKQGIAEKSLLLVWSVIILVATLGQRRFGYYLAVNVALLAGYLWWKIFELTGQKWLASQQEEIRNVKRIGKTRRRKSGTSLILNYVVLVLASLVILIVVFFGAFFGNIEPAKAVASNTPYAPSDAWVSSLNWLRDNSPEPLGSPDTYYQIQPAVPAGEIYPYPESAYGVLAWWDYGYWITRIARRIPNANPSQDPQAIFNVASFFTSQNETAASEIRQKLGSAYMVIDHETALSKFWAIVTWAGKTPYFDSYLVRQQDQTTLSQAIVYYPEYYRSMAVRMFNFDGKAVTPENTLVISYTENKDTAGKLYKIVTGVQQFATYQDAETFLSSQSSGNWRIIGIDPMKSPVPLEALEHYRLIHNSDGVITLQNGGTLPAVKIFEYVE